MNVNIRSQTVLIFFLSQSVYEGNDRDLDSVSNAHLLPKRSRLNSAKTMDNGDFGDGKFLFVCMNCCADKSSQNFFCRSCAFEILGIYQFFHLFNNLL